MRQRASAITTTLCAALITASCADSPPAPTAVVVQRPSAEVLPVIPLATDASPTDHPCRVGASRQFDFWVGEWNVNSAGTLAGTNQVRSEVDGCVVAEYWMAVGGVPGWSMNMFDAETGSWHQHWVSAGGLNLFLTGGLQGSTMVISGPRALPNGTTVIDRITYTPLAVGGLHQFWDVSSDGGQTFPSIAFNGTYQAQPGVVPAPEVPVAGCAAAAYRSADFLLGEWLIWTADGKYVGKTQFSSELSNCLLLQAGKGQAGYESKGFLAYGRLAGLWRLTHVGSDGERIFLSGAPAAGSLVLQGSELENGVPSLVRLTYAAVASDLVTQRWERSRNNGTTWERLADYELRRQ